MKKLLILALSLILPNSLHAQTYTQMQWGMDKTVNPYNFGANINNVWRNLGTVSSTGTWQIPAGNISGLPFISVSSYGVTTADTVGTTNCAGMAAAIAALPSAGIAPGGTLVFGNGMYVFNCQISYSGNKNIRITGAGKNNTTLYFNTAGATSAGISITRTTNNAYTQIDNLSIFSSVDQPAATAININYTTGSHSLMSLAKVEDVLIQKASTAYFNGFWQYGVQCTGCDASVLRNVDIVGKNGAQPATGWVSGSQMEAGVKIIGSVGSTAYGGNGFVQDHVTVYNAVYGAYLTGNNEGNVISNGAYVGVNHGIYFPDAKNWPSIMINNDSFACTFDCVYLNGIQGGNIYANWIIKRTESTQNFNAIYIDSNVSPGGTGIYNMIANNSCVGLKGTAAGGTANCVKLGPLTRENIVTGNTAYGSDYFADFSNGTYVQYVNGNTLSSINGTPISWYVNNDPAVISYGNFPQNIGSDTGWESISGATPSIGGYVSNSYLLGQSGSTNVTDFADGVVGQEISVSVTDNNTTYIHGPTLVLQNATNYSARTGDVSIFKKESATIWREISRVSSLAQYAGYRARTGTSGAYSADYMNLYWDGTNPHIYVNTFDTGALCSTNLSCTWVNQQTFSGTAPQIVLGKQTATTANGAISFLGSTSGNVTMSAQSVAGTTALSLPNTSGTLVSSASAPLAVNSTTGAVSITGAAGRVLAGASPAFTSTPTLGASGTLGSITMGNATSGTVTIQPTTGALGTVTASLPANTGTIAETNLAQTWTGQQQFNSNAYVNSTLLVGGSSTMLSYGGATNFQIQLANAGASKMVLSRFSNDAVGGVYSAAKSRGSFTTAGTVLNGDSIATNYFFADDGSTNGAVPVTSSGWGADVSGTVSTGIVPGRLFFQTMNSTGTLATRVSVMPNGCLNVTSGSPSDCGANNILAAGTIQAATAHLTTAASPSLSSCGTSPTVATGSSNNAGQFTTGSATGTACTVTFANAYANYAFCTVSPASATAGNSFYISASSKTAFTVTTTVSSQTYNYTCFGN